MATLEFQQTCPACGADNRCAVAAGRPLAECWCAHAAARAPLPEQAGPAACYCSACLAARSAAVSDRTHAR